MHGVVGETKVTSPCLGVPVFSRPRADTGLTLRTEKGRGLDGLCIWKERRVEVAEWHDDFMREVASGG